MEVLKDNIIKRQRDFLSINLDGVMGVNCDMGVGFK